MDASERRQLSLSIASASLWDAFLARRKVARSPASPRSRAARFDVDVDVDETAGASAFCCRILLNAVLCMLCVLDIVEIGAEGRSRQCWMGLSS